MTNDLLNVFFRLDFVSSPFSIVWPKFVAICISTKSPNAGPTFSPFCKAPLTNPDFILFVSQGYSCLFVFYSCLFVCCLFVCLLCMFCCLFCLYVCLFCLYVCLFILYFYKHIKFIRNTNIFIHVFFSKQTNIDRSLVHQIPTNTFSKIAQFMIVLFQNWQMLHPLSELILVKTKINKHERKKHKHEWKTNMPNIN